MSRDKRSRGRRANSKAPPGQEPFHHLIELGLSHRSCGKKDGIAFEATVSESRDLLVGSIGGSEIAKEKLIEEDGVV